MKSRTGLLLVGAAALLGVMPETWDPYVTPRLAMILAALLAVYAGPLRHAPRVEGAALAVIAAWALSAWSSIDRSASLVGAYLMPQDGLAAVVAALAALVAASAAGVPAPDLARGLLKCSIPLSLYALAQVIVGNGDPLLPGPMPVGRVIGTQGSPLYLGGCLAVVLALSVAAWVHGPAAARALPAWAAGLALPALLATRTRGAVLAAVVGALVSAPRRARLPLVAGGLAALAALFHLRGGGMSDIGRLAVWRVAAAAFLERPLLGYGPGSFHLSFRRLLPPEYVMAHHSAYSDQMHAHNEVLNVLATTGLAGLAALAALLAVCVRGLARQDDPAARRLGYAALAVVLVLGLANPVPTSVYVLAALVVGAAQVAPAVAAPARLLHWAPALGLALVGTGRVLLGDMAMADAVIYKRRGDLMSMAQSAGDAARYNPWAVEVVGYELDGILLMMPEMNPENRRLAVQAQVDIAQRAVRRHPHNSYAREYLGRSLLLAMGSGARLPVSAPLDELQEAVRLAPTFTPVIQRLENASRALGDTRRARWAGARRQLVEGWAKAGPEAL